MNVLKYKDISYVLKLSDRKTISIYVEPNGQVKILAPQGITSNKLKDILEIKSYWIYKSLAELSALNKNKTKRELVDGEGFLFLGKSYRLKIDKNLNKPLFLGDDYFYLDEKHISKAKNLFINFYKDKGLNYIPERICFFEKKMGVSSKPIRLMELKNRWASCSEKHLNFHWKTMLAPPTVVDYVLVHELSHLIEPKHNKAFWSIIESVMPDYTERKEWLRINGANLDI